MAWTERGFATKDSMTRCVLCDAPVGINGNRVITIMGDFYCEFCGESECPFCGVDSQDIENGCEALDVFNNPMHFEIDYEPT